MRFKIVKPENLSRSERKYFNKRYEYHLCTLKEIGHVDAFGRASRDMVRAAWNYAFHDLKLMIRKKALAED